MLTYNDLVKPSVLKQPIYQPGRPIELVALEFGLDPGRVGEAARGPDGLIGRMPLPAVGTFQMSQIAPHCFPLKSINYLLVVGHG